jgi:hypothetical protein
MSENNQTLDLCRISTLPLLLLLSVLMISTVSSQTAATAPTPGPAPAVKAIKVFNEKDREFALKYLNQTKDDYVNQLTGLSESQLNFRASPGRWTIGEIAEHIIVTENALFGMITEQAFKAPASAGLNEYRINDIAVILAMTNRIQKFNAPEPIRPNGRWKTTAELLSNFESTRAKTISFIKDNKLNLRNYSFNTPLVGISDSFQAFLSLGAHSERHLLQLKEVKADPAYPKK